MAKKIPMQVVVSIPRAGEFIATVQLDPDAYYMQRDPLQHGDVSNYAVDEAMYKVRVKPLKGEVQRVLKIVRNNRKEK